MMLEHAFDLSPDCDGLHRIAEQVADHANAAGMRQLDQHGEIGAMLLEGCMGRMPDALPAEDAPMGFDLGPFGVKRVAFVAEPLRAELPSLAVGAALHPKPVFT